MLARSQPSSLNNSAADLMISWRFASVFWRMDHLFGTAPCAFIIKLYSTVLKTQMGRFGFPSTFHRELSKFGRLVRHQFKEGEEAMRT
jgi:hypothetical protein